MDNYVYNSDIRLKTVTINTYFKEQYYTSSEKALKEPVETIKNRKMFWTYMNNISFQNALYQMSKAA